LNPWDREFWGNAPEAIRSQFELRALAMAAPVPTDSLASRAKASSLAVQLIEQQKGAIDWDALAPAYYLQLDEDGSGLFSACTEEDIAHTLANMPSTHATKDALARQRAQNPTHAHVIAVIWQDGVLYPKVLSLAPPRK